MKNFIKVGMTAVTIATLMGSSIKASAQQITCGDSTTGTEYTCGKIDISAVTQYNEKLSGVVYDAYRVAYRDDSYNLVPLFSSDYNLEKAIRDEDYFMENKNEISNYVETQLSPSFRLQTGRDGVAVNNDAEYGVYFIKREKEATDEYYYSYDYMIVEISVDSKDAYLVDNITVDIYDLNSSDTDSTSSEAEDSSSRDEDSSSMLEDNSSSSDVSSGSSSNDTNSDTSSSESNTDSSESESSSANSEESSSTSSDSSSNNGNAGGNNGGGTQYNGVSVNTQTIDNADNPETGSPVGILKWSGILLAVAIGCVHIKNKDNHK